VQVWEWTGNEAKRRASLWGGKEEAGQTGSHFCGVYSVAFAPDGKALAAGTEAYGAGYIHLWTLDGAKAVKRATLEGGKDGVNAVVFAPTGRTLASGGGDHSVRLWDLSKEVPEQRTVLRGHADEVSSVVYAPDGRTLASADLAGRIIVWDTLTDKQVCAIRLPGAVRDVAFAPDGHHLATANGNGTVYILRLPKSR
jgi:WD40 repeat protein